MTSTITFDLTNAALAYEALRDAGVVLHRDDKGLHVVDAPAPLTRDQLTALTDYADELDELVRCRDALRVVAPEAGMTAEETDAMPVGELARIAARWNGSNVLAGHGLCEYVYRCRLIEPQRALLAAAAEALRPVAYELGVLPSALERLTLGELDLLVRNRLLTGACPPETKEVFEKWLGFLRDNLTPH